MLLTALKRFSFNTKKEKTKLNIKPGSLFVIQISSTAPHFSHLTQHLYE